MVQLARSPEILVKVMRVEVPCIFKVVANNRAEKAYRRRGIPSLDALYSKFTILTNKFW
jgi:hypothetical protein